MDLNIDICAVIPVQQGGHDLERNALSPIGTDGIPLITWKIRQLKSVFSTGKIYVSTDSDEIKNIALIEGVNVHHRNKSLREEDEGLYSDVIYNIVNDISHEHIAWVSPVVPFMDEYDYKNSIAAYVDCVINQEFDSLMTVNDVKGYYWDDQVAINYQANKSQELRTELSNVYRVTNGLFIRSKKKILEDRYYVGQNPFKMNVSKLAGLDINVKEDHDVAMALSDLYLKQYNEKKSIVFLDFDGVVFDSVIEAYAIAMLTSKRIKTLKELDVTSKHAKRFIKQRYLIGPAWNYYYLLDAIDSDLDTNFSNFLPTEAGSAAKEFQVAFFATRQVIRNNFWNDWLSLNRLYEGSEQFIELINDNKNIVIVTTKDAPTVKALLDCYGLKRSIDIYDAKSYEEFGCKSNFMDHYIKKHHINKAIFIDDSKKHIAKCDWVDNLVTKQACWGYVSPDDFFDNKDEIVNSIIDILKG